MTNDSRVSSHGVDTIHLLPLGLDNVFQSLNGKTKVDVSLGCE